MKLHVLSDLHTEIGPYQIQVHQDQFDVLVLAGDIGTGLNGLKWAKNCGVTKPIIYVAGNHCFYGHAIPHLIHKLQDQSANTNIHFLENKEVVIGNVRFIGATLWTDFMLTGDAMSTTYAKEAMNDFVRIRISPKYRKVMPGDMIGMHHTSLKVLREKIDTPFDGKTVVVTHHAPSRKSIKDINDISPAYASNLEHLMGDKVNLWIHGHTHIPVDYVHEGTRVISNPRGYFLEGFMDDRPTGFKPEMVIEV
jgi:predicted phosphodiesterase